MPAGNGNPGHTHIGDQQIRRKHPNPVEQRGGNQSRGIAHRAGAYRHRDRIGGIVHAGHKNRGKKRAHTQNTEQNH